MIAPGEKHWHGATPGSRGVHIAVNINAQTTWLARSRRGIPRSLVLLGSLGLVLRRSLVLSPVLGP